MRVRGRVCVRAFERLCVRAFVRLCVRTILAVRGIGEDGTVREKTGDVSPCSPVPLTEGPGRTNLEALVCTSENVLCVTCVKARGG